LSRRSSKASTSAAVSSPAAEVTSHSIEPPDAERRDVGHETAWTARPPTCGQLRGWGRR
jgi:hypothetical protein